MLLKAKHLKSTSLFKVVLRLGFLLAGDHSAPLLFPSFSGTPPDPQLLSLCSPVPNADSEVYQVIFLNKASFFSMKSSGVDCFDKIVFYFLTIATTTP